MNQVIGEEFLQQRKVERNLQAVCDLPLPSVPADDSTSSYLGISEEDTRGSSGADRYTAVVSGQALPRALHVVCVGGNDGTQDLSSAERFDCTSETWTSIHNFYP